MWLKWLPWRMVLSWVARSRGFIDPVAILARLQRFAQPSEVGEPIELLRAGLVFHARGLINTRTIQHNLDWVWPYWIERQFNPRDVSFIPRAFSITHVNLTHRNWTAVGVPDCDWLPIVDPRGLLTPLHDGWSLDAWVLPDQGRPLLPSRACQAEQRLILEEAVTVETRTRQDGQSLRTRADVIWENDFPACRLALEASSDVPGWLVLTIRPVNPEGVSFIHTIRARSTRDLFRVDDSASVILERPAERVCLSDYRSGDVLYRLEGTEERAVTCDVGMATAAALYRLEPGRATELVARVPLSEVTAPGLVQASPAATASLRPVSWRTALDGVCRLTVPDQRMQHLYDAALRSLVLHSPGEVYPGPYTYKRFWFRDAAFILHALLAANLIDRVQQVVERFPQRQTSRGYFLSQEGEWDSNGEAIWILDRYRRLSGRPLSERLTRAVSRGARWITRKRLSDRLKAPHAGLLPAGFSAEHLGPNDFYYWDDFWSVAGLRSAGAILRDQGDEREASRWDQEAERLLAAVDRSLGQTASRRDRPGIPASPYRRMDAGAIGSLAADYPLQLWPPGDPRMVATAEFLRTSCLLHGGFFQDMIHSGVNAYLTLHLAQVLLRAGDPGFFALVRAVAELASPTGQWPEAIHPLTRGGCMGDGHHVWAAAEWLLIMRNLFVREETDRLVLGSGIPPDWLTEDVVLSLGPTPTAFGTIQVEVASRPGQVDVRWAGAWHRDAPVIEVALEGGPPQRVDGQRQRVTVSRESQAERRVEVLR